MAALALAQYGSGAAVTALLHPFGYAKVLMQVGYEPLAPTVSTSFIFRKEVLYYPNILQYMSHISSVDGFFGLYRGVVPRVLAGTISNIVVYNILDNIKGKIDSKGKEEEVVPKEEIEDLMEWAKAVAREASEDTVGRVCGVIISHPFHVIMVRCMVQFIGKETQYESVFSSFKETFNNEGILGFFSGLVPRLIGEVITIWATAYLTQAVHRYMTLDKEMKSYTGAACGLVVANFTYPFTLVTNVMAINNCGLQAGKLPNMPIYASWLECLVRLYQERDIKRGASTFWRVCRVPLSPSLPMVKMTSRKFR